MFGFNVRFEGKDVCIWVDEHKISVLRPQGEERLWKHTCTVEHKNDLELVEEMAKLVEFYAKGLEK